MWAPANNVLRVLLLHSFQICTEVSGEPTHTRKTTTLPSHHSCKTSLRELNTRVDWHMEPGGKIGLGGGGASVLGLFRGLWKWGLCGAAAYHSARRPKVFTYWLVPCNLDGGNGRAISLASKWATHLNTRGQKGSGTRIPPLVRLIQRLMANISWTSTNKHLSISSGMIHSRKRQWRKFRFAVF